MASAIVLPSGKKRASVTPLASRRKASVMAVLFSAVSTASAGSSLCCDGAAHRVAICCEKRPVPIAMTVSRIRAMRETVFIWCLLWINPVVWWCCAVVAAPISARTREPHPSPPQSKEGAVFSSMTCCVSSANCAKRRRFRCFDHCSLLKLGRVRVGFSSTRAHVLELSRRRR